MREHSDTFILFGLSSTVNDVRQKDMGRSGIHFFKFDLFSDIATFIKMTMLIKKNPDNGHAFRDIYH